jgi:hypothetical protein
VGGTIDIGAYESQAPALLPYYDWLQSYSVPTDPSIDGQDTDGDKATTWQEWKMRTIPTNGLSVLKLAELIQMTNVTEVSWQSVVGHRYTLERATNGFSNFSVLQSNITSQGDTTMFTDTTEANGNTFLYRVSVPE